MCFLLILLCRLCPFFGVGEGDRNESLCFVVMLESFLRFLLLSRQYPIKQVHFTCHIRPWKKPESGSGCVHTQKGHFPGVTTPEWLPTPASHSRTPSAGLGHCSGLGWDPSFYLTVLESPRPLTLGWKVRIGGEATGGNQMWLWVAEG